MLRNVTINDFAKLFEWVNDYEVRQNARYTEEKTLDEYKKWFCDALNDKAYIMFVYINNSKEVGQVKLQISEREIIFNYSIDKDNRGKGFGSAAISEAENFIRENQNLFTEINNLTAYVRTSNIASCRVLEKLGYKKAFECEDYIKYQKKYNA